MRYSNFLNSFSINDDEQHMRYSNFLNSFSINDLLYKVLKHKNKDNKTQCFA